MTTDSLADLRSRLYEAYATQHAGCGGDEAAALVYRRDIRPLLPPPAAGPVVDLGCGRGELVRLLQADGFDAEGIDISPEQAALARAAGVARVRQGDFRAILAAHPAHYAAITATDLLEHLTKPEVLQTFDDVAAALAPGGVFVGRVPNAVSPLGGHIRNGDFTHQTSFTARSIRQLAAAAGFDSVLARSSPPVAHGLASAARVMVWQVVSACYRIALAAETGMLRGHIVTQNLTFAARKGVEPVNPAEKKPGMTGRVLLLSPSRGLGGGIERYVATVEWAFAAEGVECQRLDLSGSGARAHARLLAQGRAILRADSEPARLVVAHRALLPVAALLARDSAVCGVSVLCYGSEMWGSRWRPRRNLERRLMRGAGVRVVACSNFTAGALMRDCRATVLPPALSREWFDTLAAAAAGRPGRGPGIRLATAFRLSDWRTKGLPQLVEAVTALGRPDVCLTICGSGNPPADLLRLVSEYSWCVLRPGLSDDDLARELAAADLFVLATQTRSGRGAVGEGFGLVLLEAQAAGTPVIAPAYGGSREAYIEGVTGVAPADESAEALTRTLHDLLKDPARLAWMGGHAAQWTRQAFAPERYAQLAVRRLL